MSIVINEAVSEFQNATKNLNTLSVENPTRLANPVTTLTTGRAIAQPSNVSSESTKSPTNSIPTVNEQSVKSPLKNITNANNGNLKKSVGLIGKYLHWPADNLLQNNKNKIKKNTIRVPPIVSGDAYQTIKQTQEDEKRKKSEEILLKKRIKTEKLEKTKIEKEQNRIKKKRNL